MKRIRLETTPASPFERCFYDWAEIASVKIDGVPICHDHAGRELADLMFVAKILADVHNGELVDLPGKRTRAAIRTAGWTAETSDDIPFTSRKR